MKTTLILLSLLLPVTAQAATFYTINFSTSTGTAPTSGSFDYDSGTGFSNFLVVWEGQTFNLTSAANAPDVLTPTNCSGEGSNQQFGFIIMSGTATGCTGTASDRWSGSDPSGFPRFEFFLSAGTGRDVIAGLSSPQGGLVDANGFWTITATAPEPSSFILSAIALLMLYGLRRSRLKFK